MFADLVFDMSEIHPIKCWEISLGVQIMSSVWIKIKFFISYEVGQWASQLEKEENQDTHHHSETLCSSLYKELFRLEGLFLVPPKVICRQCAASIYRNIVCCVCDFWIA
jgi:hypothetical protein